MENTKLVGTYNIPDSGKPPYFLMSKFDISGLDNVLTMSQISFMSALSLQPKQSPTLVSCEVIAEKISRKPVTIRHIANKLCAMGILNRVKGKGRGNKPVDIFFCNQLSIRESNPQHEESTRHLYASNWFALMLMVESQLKTERNEFSTNKLVPNEAIDFYVQIISSLYKHKLTQAELMSKRELPSSELYNNKLTIRSSDYPNYSVIEFEQKVEQLSEFNFKVAEGQNVNYSYFYKLVTKRNKHPLIEYDLEFPIELINKLLESSLMIFFPKILERINLSTHRCLTNLHIFVLLNICINDIQALTIQETMLDRLLTTNKQADLIETKQKLASTIEYTLEDSDVSSSIISELNIKPIQSIRIKLEKDVIFWCS
ncbi:hypothetical protein DS2_15424 [Catenovulum agarivorans DS-2]|uniref:Uncharacterized protein n=1 Tax=Catenovulum agarivorans DS-2 TaxID=1328313 RepID=W7QIU8_9ALTE|nr:hypothetical protein [Catenovulum agarivorans]EWH08862.1 hypothetical protein DS2_15424 [Catenovulum agarivorans DS-2]